MVRSRRASGWRRGAGCGRKVGQFIVVVVIIDRSAWRQDRRGTVQRNCFR